jgi:Zn-finger nucleic acid-binding protein
MRCPACGVAMAARSFGPVDVDFCELGCGGLWFDWAELAKVDEPHEGFGEALDAALARPPRKPRSAPLRCARCDVPMREHLYRNLPRILIDECYGCRGFFLDPGELRAIRETLGARQQRQSAVDQLLATDVVFRRHQIEAEKEATRLRALELIAEGLARKLPWSIS